MSTRAAPPRTASPRGRMRRLAPAVLVVLAVPILMSVPQATSAAAATDAERATAAYQRMSVAQRIGQLFMVAMPSTGSTTAQRATLTKYAVGNAMLNGHSTAGVSAVAGVVRPVRTATTQAKVLPFVATDQEGGYVQDLAGPGFSSIPRALTQGGYAASTLRADAKTWGGQLARAGINLDLAPVADVVPKLHATDNQPIGRWYREYAYYPDPAATHVVAFLRGMRDAGVGTTAKHFPGLGRATGNTDETSGVTDPTTRHDSYLKPFASAISWHVPFVMLSTATYPNIDPRHKAAFSRLISTTMLRGDLGFTGVVISDSLTVPSLSYLSYAKRALRFIRAGGDVILLSSTAPLHDMTQAIRATMTSDPKFAALVKAAVMKVLTAKAHAGLL